MSCQDGWRIVWWFPLRKRKTGLFRINPFLSKFGTAYKWVWE